MTRAMVNGESLASDLHRVDYLFRRLRDLDYPDGVVPVPEMIAGTAFFPGGSGLWRPTAGGRLPQWPLGKIMVLGHNFNKEKNYRQAMRVGHELNTPTWRALLPLLDDAGIRREHCFFTNVYMGLKVAASNLGAFTGEETFKRRCESFLDEQIAVLQPRLILALGGFVPGPLASRSPDLTAWTACPEDRHGRRRFKDLDAAGPVQHGVRFGERTTTVVALLHPYSRTPSFARNPELRRYRGLKGNNAEQRMLHEAIAVSNYK